MNLPQLRYGVPCFTSLNDAGIREYKNISADEQSHQMIKNSVIMDVLGFLLWSESYYFEFVDRFSSNKNNYYPEKFENITPIELNGIHIDIEFCNGKVAMFKVYKS